MQMESPLNLTCFQNVIPPMEWEKLGLYLKTNSTQNWRLAEFPELGPAEYLSTETYFNQLIEGVPAKIFGMKVIYLKIELKGSGKLTLYRTLESCREIVSIRLLNEGTSCLEISLDNEKLGGLSFELEAQSELCQLKRAAWMAPLPKFKKSLAVLICTYGRAKELLHNLKAIQNSPFLSELKIEIFVVDHAKSLTKENLPQGPLKTHLIPQENRGGSGGFGRALIEASSFNFDYFLFMDDDIQLDPEMIFRALLCLAHSQNKICLAGSMLDSIDCGKLYESGAWVEKKHPFTLKSRFSGIDVLQSKSLIPLCHPSHLKPLDDFYGAWWFWAFPKEVVEKCGFPHPLFIKFDDVEFGVRASRAGFPTIAPANIGVHHEPFYAKNDSAWPDYYFMRNALVFSFTQRSDSLFSLLYWLWKNWTLSMAIFRYDRGQAALEAIRDFMKGPEYLVQLTGHHSEKMKSLVSAGLKSNVESEQFRDQIEIPRNVTPRSLISILNLNGHFWAKKPSLQVFFKDDIRWFRVRASQLLAVNPLTNSALQYQIDRPRFFHQLKEMIQNSFLFLKNGNKLRKQYLQAHENWIRRDFWLKYLEEAKPHAQNS